MVAKTLTIETEFSFDYITRSPVPIPEMVDSLLGLERMLLRSKPFLTKALKTEVDDIDVYVASISTGSLLKKLLVTLSFKDTKSRDRAIQSLDELENSMIEGVDGGSTLKLILGGVVGSLITYSAMQMLQASGESAPQIQAYNSTIVQFGGNTGIAGDEFQALLNSSPNKKALAKDTIAVMRPAKTSQKAGDQPTVRLAGIDALTMSNDLISELPADYSPPQPDTKDEYYSDLSVEIYASDREKRGRPWAGSVPQLSIGRINFDLSDNIDPVWLQRKVQVRANLTVTSKFDKKTKTYKPSLVLITAVDGMPEAKAD